MTLRRHRERRAGNLLALLCAAAFVVACAEPDPFADEHQGAAGIGEVGAACDVDADCTLDLVCVQELPGGFCTRDCDWECPGDNLCVRVEFPGGVGFWACVPQCENSSECREDYACRPIVDRQVCTL